MKIKVYLLRMRNANTFSPINIVRKNKENLQKFKEDADKDKRYITCDIEEKEAESITVDNTVFALNVYDTIGMRETYYINQENLTYNDFLKRELGLR